MTTQEYIKKYELNLSNKFNHSIFIKDLSSDFMSLLELNKANDNIKGFENALRCIKMKFDAINNKTVGSIPESLWKFFFATVVVKLRDQLCPKDMEKRRAQQEFKKKKWEQRKAREKWEQQEFQSFFWDNMFSNLMDLIGIQRKIKPVASFIFLGLSESATEEEVKCSYRKLSLLHHPDKGGKQDDFIKITQAKNECLDWITMQNIATPK